MKKTILICLAAAALAGCNAKKEAPAAAASAIPPQAAGQAQPASGAQLPPSHPAVAAAPANTPNAAASASQGLSGKVVETMNSGGYTYMKLKTASGEVWAAVPQAQIKKGETVSVQPQMTMDNFESNTLKRKFDKLLFATLLGPAGAAPASAPATAPAQPAAMMPGGNPMGTPQQHMNAPDAPIAKVAKAEGADGKTVAEVWAGKGSLADKPVAIRGTVVKSLTGIMGKNWIHLRDGSGGEGTNDLTITTNDVAKVGDVVLVRGTLRVDKDFGAGYRYAVIVEDASVTK